MQYNIQLVSTKYFAVPCFWLAALLLSLSCRKESTLAESDLDENYFVVKDNPNDPADHAMYQFYSSTGIASFYTDTIYKKKVADTSGVPVYSYVTLSLNYSLFHSESTSYQWKRLTSKTDIPSLLDLLKTELLPRLPAGTSLPSIWLLDSITFKANVVRNIKLTDGWTSLQGFNTVGIDVRNVELMTSEERKMYVASILAGIAERRMNLLFEGRLQRDFFSVSRNKTSTMIPVDIYNNLPMYILVPNLNIPRPEDIGFIRYHDVDLFGTNPPEVYRLTPPNQSEDLRIYLAHLLYYSEQELTEKYLNDALVLKKLSVIRGMLKEAGFKLPG